MTANAPQSSGLLTVLHRDWGKADAWAEENSLTDELLRVIVTCRIRDKPNLFGSFLAQITSPKPFALLEQWRLTESSAGVLHDLAVAARNSTILSSYRKITDKVPAKKQLAELDTHYLIGLLIERLPPIEAERQEWFERLRMWILVHAFERSSWGIIQDGCLHFISARLRMASDNSRSWRETFLLLQPPELQNGAVLPE